jgi:cell division protein FtsL
MMYRGGFLPKLSIVFLSLITVILIFMLVWLRSNLVKMEYELGQYQRLKETLLDEKRRLILEREKLTSLQNIERIAINRLHLSTTERKKVFYVKITESPKPFVTGFEKY